MALANFGSLKVGSCFNPEPVGPEIPTGGNHNWVEVWPWPQSTCHGCFAVINGEWPACTCISCVFRMSLICRDIMWYYINIVVHQMIQRHIHPHTRFWHCSTYRLWYNLRECRGWCWNGEGRSQAAKSCAWRMLWKINQSTMPDYHHQSIHWKHVSWLAPEMPNDWGWETAGISSMQCRTFSWTRCLWINFRCNDRGIGW